MTTALQPGDVVVTKHNGRITLTATPGTILNGLDDNWAVVTMDMGSLGIVIARIECELGSEVLVLAHGNFGWNMAEHFKRYVDVLTR